MVTNTRNASLDERTFYVQSRIAGIMVLAFLVPYTAFGILVTVDVMFAASQLIATGDWDWAGLAPYAFSLLVGCLSTTLGLLFTRECLVHSTHSLHLDDSGNLVVDTLMRQHRVPLASIREIQIDFTQREENENVIIIILRPRGKITMPPFPDYEKFLALVLTAQPSIQVTRLPDVRPATP